MFADVCILLAFVCRRSPNVCRRLHTSYFRPLDPGLCILPALGSMVVHTAGPVGADHSRGFQTARRGSQLLDLVCRRSPNVCRRLHTAGLESGVVHTSGHWIQGCASCWPMDPGLCILLARSALITRWDSKPARRGSQLLGLVCRRSPNVCRRLHTSYFRPLDPGLCIMLAHGSRVVHTAGPVGVDHSMGFQPARRGSQLLALVCRRSPNVCRRLQTSGPGIHGCAYFRPLDPGLCILPAIGSKVVHRVPSRGDRSCWPGRR
jgi:hypothetical protein